MPNLVYGTASMGFFDVADEQDWGWRSIGMKGSKSAFCCLVFRSPNLQKLHRRMALSFSRYVG